MYLLIFLFITRGHPTKKTVNPVSNLSPTCLLQNPEEIIQESVGKVPSTDVVRGE